MASSTMSVRQLRDLETKLQEKIYENVSLLTHFYPTSKEFDRVFKSTMFAQINKAAFQQVVHYLFTIVDPTNTKEKITAWPLYDVKMEPAFRQQLLEFVSFLNKKYEYADLPNLMASQVITPKGTKFLKFMLKLSILAMHEHLIKDKTIAQVLVAPPRSHKSLKITKKITDCLEAATKVTEEDVAKMSKEFYEEHRKNVEEAERLVEQQKELVAEVRKVKEKLEKESNLPGVDLESLTSKLERLQEEMKVLEKYKGLAETGRQLLSHVCSGESLLEFKKDEFRVPTNVAHFFPSEQLNLCQLFKSLSVVLEQLNFDLPTFTSTDFENVSSVVTDLTRKYSDLDHKLSLRKAELEQLSNAFFEKKEEKRVPDIVVTFCK